MGSEVQVDVPGPISPNSILNALEAAYPVLKGTIREHGTGKRRPFLRFFACGEDVSLDPMDSPLADAIGAGVEPFMVVGAIAGG